ncbi:methylated-DNA--[protein]-cysteine S-methyltransferase [Rhizobium halophytocola]|uniref:AraC family transcriptional regulator of adaptative response/methylated-DNA-[protein]-cysteine methyltransferase n=1 Tax=Rhizobium halophytocola TaxID=735519 RepID=A0ABS4E070_9HYPH|nr:methylated-DNA--[protein]-cysteine S-methyltransferase [Rhizobium halophytocola]MBP1851328.1 AraC family transcriptional regulator of adaptative response/methylated-DNA-[protein]-cysteine methyltransferase [Rhizobium halophytocola]
MLYTQWFESPLGDLIAVADETHLKVLSFRDRAEVKGVEHDLTRSLGQPLDPNGNAVTARIAAEMASYFAGEGADFSIPLAPEGSEFEQAVWARLLTVPAGETCSYGDIARKVGGLETSRAVGRANNANPIVIVIPCHRCIGADGSLTGYGGGLWRKKWLLRHEADMCPVGLFAL